MSEEGTFYHYLGLLIGMAFIGSYLYYLLMPFGITTPPTINQTLAMILTAIVLTISTIGISFSKTRNSRIATTILSGTLAGFHGYMVFILYTPGAGIILFAWISFGLLLAFSTLNWLVE